MNSFLKSAIQVTALGFAAVITLFGQMASAQEKFTDAEIRAIKAVQSKMAPRLPYVLNLGDKQQYDYVLAMLRVAGDSPARSPHFYRLLEAERARRKAGPPKLAPGYAEVVGTTNAVAPITPINAISFMANQGPSVLSNLLSSVPNGTQNTKMMVNYRMTNESQPFATSPVYAQYNGGLQFEQAYSAKPTAAGSVVASALFTTTVNNIPTTYTAWAEGATPNATDQCVTAPNYIQFQNAPATCPPAGSTCINKGSVTTNIVSCYGRNSQNPPCNYGWGGSGYPPSLTLVICGTMTFPYPINASLQGAYSMYLQRKDNGGCVLNGSSAIGPLPTANFSINPTNNKILNYSFPASQFPSNACMQQAWVDMYLTLDVTVLIDVTGLGSNYGNGTISSDPTNNPNQPWFALIPTITVLQGCVASGTMVTMADGSGRAIEKVKGDGSDWLMINVAGDKMAVVGITDGIEKKPMVQIIDSEGHRLLVSEMHPIVTPNGMVPAIRLKVGDTVVTRKGKAMVRRVSRIRYPGKVWNLTYGPTSVIGEGKSTFFANGILVGDLAMQQHMRDEARRRGASKEETLRDLPKAWHRDFLNWYAEQQKTPR